MNKIYNLSTAHQPRSLVLRAAQPYYWTLNMRWRIPWWVMPRLWNMKLGFSMMNKLVWYKHWADVLLCFGEFSKTLLDETVSHSWYHCVIPWWHHWTSVLQLVSWRWCHREEITWMMSWRRHADVLADFRETQERQPQKTSSNPNSLQNLSVIIKCYWCGLKILYTLW